MTPDVELLLCTYLRATSAVTDLVGDRVGTRTPLSTGEPWVTVTLIDTRADQTSSALHFMHAPVQIDCYAGEPREDSQAEASLIARTILGALAVIGQATHSGAVVSCARDLALRPLPDAGFSPARERYIVQATLHLHG
jgi:hypothetical protein